ncbi:hypothetical protein T484DRAFT_1791141 [Baffinella frigidus]|nr:hypothetical protein T484DRAFT_1791141 [Cryptophyta sp. CCMP2293]
MQVAMTRAVAESDPAEGLKRARTLHDAASPCSVNASTHVAMTRAVADSDSAEGLKRARTLHDEASMLRERLDSQAAIAREEASMLRERLDSQAAIAREEVAEVRRELLLAKADADSMRLMSSGNDTTVSRLRTRADEWENKVEASGDDRLAPEVLASQVRRHSPSLPPSLWTRADEWENKARNVEARLEEATVDSINLRNRLAELQARSGDRDAEVADMLLSFKEDSQRALVESVSDVQALADSRSREVQELRSEAHNLRAELRFASEVGLSFKQKVVALEQVHNLFPCIPKVVALEREYSVVNSEAERLRAEQMAMHALAERTYKAQGEARVEERLVQIETLLLRHQGPGLGELARLDEAREDLVSIRALLMTDTEVALETS